MIRRSFVVHVTNIFMLSIIDLDSKTVGKMTTQSCCQSRIGTNDLLSIV